MTAFGPFFQTLDDFLLEPAGHTGAKLYLSKALVIAATTDLIPNQSREKKLSMRKMGPALLMNTQNSGKKEITSLAPPSLLFSKEI